MKSLKPSLRERKRYLLIRGENLKENVEKAILEYIGILGMAQSSPKWIELKKDSGILSVNREKLDFIKASFVIFQKKLEVKKVSGTLRGLKNNSIH
jgi:RNase P/RNase MRP subunit POP5